MPLYLPPSSVTASAVARTDDFTLIVPAGHFIDRVFIINNTANAITGGLKFGTTSGATNVITTIAVGANAIVMATEAELALRFFSKTAPQTLFVQDVTAWNSANIDVHLILQKLY